MDGHWQFLLLPLDVSLKNGDIQQWIYSKTTMTQHIEDLYHPWACSPGGRRKKKRRIDYIKSGPFTSYTSSNSKSPKQAKLSCLYLSISQVRVKKKLKMKRNSRQLKIIWNSNFSENKYCWNTATPAHSYIVYGCVHSATAGLSSCDRGHMALNSLKYLPFAPWQKHIAGPCARALDRSSLYREGEKTKILKRVLDWPSSI